VARGDGWHAGGEGATRCRGASRPLRILFVVSTLEPDWSGGIGRVAAGFARELARRGHRVHLAGRSRHGPPGVLPRVRVHAWPGRLGRAGQIPPLLGLLHRLRPDVLHFHTARPHGPPALAAVALRAVRAGPAVILSPYTGTRAHRIGWAGRAALGRADAVLTSSRWAAEQMEAAGAPPSRLRVVPPGVDLPEVPERRPEPLLLFLGRLAPSKGPGVLLEAFARIAADHPRWRLCLAGEGPEAGALRHRARELGLADRVALPGRVTGAAREAWFARAALAAVPSLHDNFPGALLELLARGVPCVAARAGGIPEIAGPEGAVRLVPPGDPGELAAALQDLLERPDEREALAQAGRRRAEALAWPRVAAELESVYRKLAGGGRGA